MNALELARLQFAPNVSFHILFQAIPIGLSWILLFFRVRYTVSRSDEREW
jgi:cytochrome d ubiquinol oxidase subunit I